MEGVRFSRLEKNGQYARFSLKGPAYYNLLEQLGPRLDGQASRDELIKSLHPADRPQASELLTFLLDHQLVRDNTTDRASGLTKLELSRFASQINYIGCYAGDAAWRFEQFRRASVLLVGSNLLANKTAQALGQNGLAELNYGPTSSHEPVTLAFPGKLILHSPATLAKQTWTAYDLVLYAGDAVGLAEVAEFCRLAGTPFYPVFYRGETGLTGWLQLPGQPGCWRCLEKDLEDGESAFFGPTTAGILANTLAYRVFRYLTGLVGAAQRTLYRLDLDTLSQSQQALDPAKLCPACTVLLAQEKN
jgi:hypothetical protein